VSPETAREQLLVAELRRDWAQVEARLQEASAYDPGTGKPFASHVALMLAHAYEAFETLLVRVERALGLPPRSGERWHTDILEAAALDLPDVRPACIPSAALPDWHAVRRFRHFLRHAYAVDLDPSELTRARTHLTTAVRTTSGTVARLVDALRDGASAS